MHCLAGKQHFQWHKGQPKCSSSSPGRMSWEALVGDQRLVVWNRIEVKFAIIIPVLQDGPNGSYSTVLQKKNLRAYRTNQLAFQHFQLLTPLSLLKAFWDFKLVESYSEKHDLCPAVVIVADQFLHCTWIKLMWLWKWWDSNSLTLTFSKYDLILI